jgi:hypothetical protein
MTYHRFVTRLTRRMSLVEQELLTLPEHPRSPPIFSGVCVTQSLVLYVYFCRSLFVLLYFIFWPLCCLFLFDVRILVTLLVSSNSSVARRELEHNISTWYSTLQGAIFDEPMCSRIVNSSGFLYDNRHATHNLFW